MKTELYRFQKNASFLFELFERLSELLGPGLLETEIDSFIRSQAGAAGYTSALGTVAGEKSLTNFCSLSTNQVAAHGVPSQRALVEGDLLSVDIAIFDGYLHADAAWTYCVGQPSASDQELLQTAWQTSLLASQAALDSPRIRAVADAASAAVAAPFVIPTGCYGHGIGKNLHQAPRIPFSRRDPLYKTMYNSLLPDNSAFTIEPIVLRPEAGQEAEPTLSVAADGSMHLRPQGRCAQFEFMLWRDAWPGKSLLLSLPQQANGYPDSPLF